jgi:glycosyltransferase involved in cell wall biosynthesis
MEKMLLCSASEWARLGYSCDLLATSPQIGPLAPTLREAGFGIFHIPFRSKYRYLLRARFIPEYFNLCRSGYDVVHLHIEAATPIFALLTKLAGVPRLVLTPHSVYDFTGLLRARKYLERWFIRLLGGRYGMISEGVQQCEWDRYRNRGVRTWNWLDTSHFRPPSDAERDAARESFGCRPGQFVVVSVGNCSEHKNHSELLRAVASLPQRLRPYYLHVGRGSDHEQEQQIAAELGIEDTVKFCGSQPDPRPYLWASDVFAMPSVREGLGISALEAIACGTPAVLTDIEGLREGAAGTESTVFTAKEATSIANGLMRIAESPKDLVRLKSLADSERVRHQYSIEKGVRSIVEGLYQAAAAQGHSGRQEVAV